MPIVRRYPTTYEHRDEDGTPPTHWANPQNIVGEPDNLCATFNTIGYDIGACSYCKLYGKGFGFNIPDNAQLVSVRMGLDRAIRMFMQAYPAIILTIGIPYRSLGSYFSLPRGSLDCSNSEEGYAPEQILDFIPLTVADLNNENFYMHVSVSLGAGNSYGIAYVDTFFLEVEYTVPVAAVPKMFFHKKGATMISITSP